MTYRFGPFAADRTTYRVCEGARDLALTPKLLDLLFYFLEHPAALVTKEELLDRIWPGANVTDNALAQAISDLRDALHDSPSAPVYIRTVARRGYRFVSPVEVVVAVPATPPPPVTVAGTPDAGVVRRAIAVLDFTNVTGDADVGWLSAGIAETVTNDLSALDRFRVIDRWRVVGALRGTDGSGTDLAAVLGVDWLVTGSYQRSGAALRVTARIVDLERGEAIADAKLDGPIDDVFALQDGIVAAFGRAMGVPAATPRLRARETPSLEAYRAYTEGWLKVESFDTSLVDAAIRDFERAIALDPGYAMAYTGLATAETAAYEMTRALPAPNTDALTSGIGHARQALRVDPRLGEAHAALSFLLASSQTFDEARSAALRAVAIEPDSWRHQYRLGHACWGDARLRALDRALALYPQFAYARLESAMVHVARGGFDDAEDLVRRGAAEQDRQARRGDRFPAIGFHWLLGALELARGDVDGAVTELDRELEQASRRRLYGPEYAAAALVWRGHAEIARDRADRARASFADAFDHIDDDPHAHLGLALAHDRLGDRRAAGQSRQRLHAAIERLERTGRSRDACLLRAGAAILRADRTAALLALDDLIGSGPPTFFGWTIPIEPCLRSLHGDDGFDRLLARLAEGAR